jgi:hypothetical protein
MTVKVDNEALHNLYSLFNETVSTYGVKWWGG